MHESPQINLWRCPYVFPLYTLFSGKFLNFYGIKSKQFHTTDSQSSARTAEVAP